MFESPLPNPKKNPARYESIGQSFKNALVDFGRSSATICKQLPELLTLRNICQKLTIPVDGFVDRKTELQSECLAAKIGFGRAENEPSKIGQEIGNMILLWMEWIERS